MLSYAFLKLLVWIGLAIIVGLYIKPQWVYWFLAIGGVVESLIGFGQFLAQKSLGLQILGESVLSPLNPDLARIFIDADGWGRLLRAYGTFPHPNILAAFLVLSLLALYYFYSGHSDSVRVIRVGILAATFIVWLGLLLTFSRAGWLIALIVSAMAVYQNKKLLLPVVVSVLALILIFSWAILPRVSFIDQFALEQRLGDYQLAWQLIKEKPFFGHGLTLAMPERPIHNLYLLIATEIGLVGLFGFLGFIIFTLIENWKLEIENWPAIIMLGALLLFGLADHFLWTLRPGLAMLWLIIGLNFKNKLS